MTHQPFTLAMAIVCLVFAGMMAGCGHTLFSGSPSTSENRIDKYYGGDSAVQTTESRRRTADMGFGYPTGNPDQ